MRCSLVVRKTVEKIKLIQQNIKFSSFFGIKVNADVSGRQLQSCICIRVDIHQPDWSQKVFWPEFASIIAKRFGTHWKDYSRWPSSMYVVHIFEPLCGTQMCGFNITPRHPLLNGSTAINLEYAKIWIQFQIYKLFIYHSIYCLSSLFLFLCTDTLKVNSQSECIFSLARPELNCPLFHTWAHKGVCWQQTMTSI